MDMVFTNGLMGVNSKAIGKKIKLQAMVCIIGRMEEFMRDTGSKIICMVKVCINGQMEGNMKGSMLMIKRRDLEFTNIQTADVIKDNGSTVNNMEKEPSLAQKEYLEKANGKMEKGFIGLMK